MRTTQDDTARTAGRPRVICHMLTSVDGRIVDEAWPLSGERRREYEAVHATYEPDAWLCGRVTMEQHFAAGTRSDAEVSRMYDGPPRADFVAPRAAGEHGKSATPRRLVLDGVERRADDVLWLRYRVVGP